MLTIASKYGVSPARIALAWHLSRGTIAVTASKNIERQKENKDASLFSVFVCYSVSADLGL